MNRAIWIHAAAEGSFDEFPLPKGWDGGVGGEQREKGRLSRPVESAGSQAALGLGLMPTLGDAGQTQRLSGGSAVRTVGNLGIGRGPPPQPEDASASEASLSLPSSSLCDSVRALDDERAMRDTGVV